MSINVPSYNAAVASIQSSTTAVTPEDKAALALQGAKDATTAAQTADVKVSDAMDTAQAATGDDAIAAQVALRQAIAEAQAALEAAVQAQKVANEFAGKAGKQAPFVAAAGVRNDFQIGIMPQEQVRSILGLDSGGGTATAGAPTISAGLLQNLDPAKLNAVLAKITPGNAATINPSGDPGSADGPPRPRAWVLAHAGVDPNSPDFTYGSTQVPPVKQPFNASERQIIENAYRSNPADLLKAADPTGNAPNADGIIMVPGSYLAELRGDGATIPKDSGTDPLFDYNQALGGYVKKLGLDVGGNHEIWRSPDGKISMQYFDFPSADDPTKNITGRVYAFQNGTDANGKPTYDLKFQKNQGDPLADMPKISADQRTQILGILTTDASKNVPNRTIRTADLAKELGLAPSGPTLPPGVTAGVTLPFTTNYQNLNFLMTQNSDGSVTVNVPRDDKGVPTDPRLKDFGPPKTFKDGGSMNGNGIDDGLLLAGYHKVQDKGIAPAAGAAFYNALDPTTMILNDAQGRFNDIKLNGTSNVIPVLDPKTQRAFTLDAAGNGGGKYPELAALLGGGAGGSLLYSKAENKLYWQAGDTGTLKDLTSDKTLNPTFLAQQKDLLSKGGGGVYTTSAQNLFVTAALAAPGSKLASVNTMTIDHSNYQDTLGVLAQGVNGYTASVVNNADGSFRSVTLEAGGATRTFNSPAELYAFMGAQWTALSADTTKGTATDKALFIAAKDATTKLKGIPYFADPSTSTIPTLYEKVTSRFGNSVADLNMGNDLSTPAQDAQMLAAIKKYLDPNATVAEQSHFPFSYTFPPGDPRRESNVTVNGTPYNISSLVGQLLSNGSANIGGQNLTIAQFNSAIPPLNPALPLAS